MSLNYPAIQAKDRELGKQRREGLTVVHCKLGDSENYTIEFQTWPDAVAAHGELAIETRTEAVAEPKKIQFALSVVCPDGKPGYMFDSIPEEGSLEEKQAAIIRDKKQTHLYVMHSANQNRDMEGRQEAQPLSQN